MQLAQEPCLFYYIQFLVKYRGTLNVAPIQEAQGAWDSLCQTFNVERSSGSLIDSIDKINKDVYFDKRVKRLDTIRTEDNMIVATQILAHDMLILCIVLNEIPNYRTDTPYKSWINQFEKINFLKGLNQVYNEAFVLQTITNDPDQVASVVQKELPSFQSDKLHSCIFNFGKLWQFGSQKRFLLTIKRETEDDANKFLANNFAYILTLLSKIDEHYSMAVKLYEQITGQETLVNQLKLEINEIIKTDDLTLLNQKRNEVRGISEESTNNLAYLRDCGNNIRTNLINLEAALENLNLVEETDNIFKLKLGLFDEHVLNIESWVSVCQSSLIRINKIVHDTLSVLKERIDTLTITNEAKEIALAIPRPLNAEPKRIESFNWGTSYIMNENELEKSLDIFEQIYAINRRGLCITRTNLNKIKSSRNLDTLMSYWLCSSSCENCIPPIPDKVLHVITPFLLIYDGSVVLIEGLEYLKMNNEFNNVLKLLEHIKEQIALHNSILILSLSYPAFTDQEISLIKKNMVCIAGDEFTIDQLNKGGSS